MLVLQYRSSKTLSVSGNNYVSNVKVWGKNASFVGGRKNVGIDPFSWWKNKRTVLDDRKLPLCHATVGETKALTSRISKLLEECNQIIWGGFGGLYPSSTQGL